MASNTVWWNGTNDMAWGQINNSTSTNSATFNGPDGTWLAMRRYGAEGVIDPDFAARQSLPS